MNHTRTALCFATLALALIPACLGDDPDHIPTTGYGGLGKLDPGHVTPSAGPVLHALLLSNLRVDYAGDAPDKIAAPELCGDCTVTIDRALLGATVGLSLRDEAGTELCRVVGRPDAITVDTCGMFDP